MKYIEIMRNIEATSNITTLESLAQNAITSNLPLEQKMVAFAFAQTSLSYNTIKQDTRDDSAERNVLAEALDTYRNFEHTL